MQKDTEIFTSINRTAESFPLQCTKSFTLFLLEIMEFKLRCLMEE